MSQQDVLVDGVVPPGSSSAAGVVALVGTAGLVVLSGPAGCGRSVALRRVGEAFGGRVFAGGGLSMLRSQPGLALSRAVRAKLPTHDVALCVEAVRSRVRGGLLVIDDVQWCDAVTLAVLPQLAQYCRVVVALRVPHRLPEAVVASFREVGRFVDVAPLSVEASARLVRSLAPVLAGPAVEVLVRRGGGNPLVLSSLARYAQRRGDAGVVEPDEATPGAVYAIAESIADLGRPARTALAALGLLGRPASVGLLGEGVAELVTAGLVRQDGDVVAAGSPYVAEIAAGLLDTEARQDLHRKLASLVEDVEAARHLAAAGDIAAARDRALGAAEAGGNRARVAEALLFAVSVDPQVDDAVRVSAARAALAVGRPRSALTVLAHVDSVEATMLSAQAHLHAGHAEAAREACEKLPDVRDVDDVAVAAEIDRVRLLTYASSDDARELADEVRARRGARPAHFGVAAALAAVDARHRVEGWQAALASAAASAGREGDVLSARWSAWLLVECLMSDGELGLAARAADGAARACTDDHAYSWQSRFLAARVWCEVLGGREVDGAAARAVTLLDHALPSVARGYASAAASLAEADAGALRTARHRLRRAGPVPPSVAGLLRWVAGESAWLDNQPSAVESRVGVDASLVAGLWHITAAWAAVDAQAEMDLVEPVGLPSAAVVTLSAWRDVVAGEPGGVFVEAAQLWSEVVVREQVRCLLAFGRYAADVAAAVSALEEAERLAEGAGLSVLAGRARQGLRRHRVRRDRRGRRAGGDLTQREQEVLRLVALGEPTRRIAGTLGIARETVETHIRAGMRKLGARTRTEAAVRATAVLDQVSD